MVDAFTLKLEKLDSIIDMDGHEERDLNQLESDVNKEIKDLNIFSQADFQNSFLN